MWESVLEGESVCGRVWESVCERGCVCERECVSVRECERESVRERV